MPQAKGANVTIGYQAESTYATDPGSPDLRKLHFLTEGLRLSQDVVFSQTITGDRNPTTPIRGNKTVTGQITCELQAYIGTLFKAALGSCTTTGTESPYTHTIKLGSSIPSLTIEKAFTDLTTAQYFKYNGCKVKSLALSLKPDGYQECRFDFVGAKETVGTAAFDATLTDAGKQSWNGFQVNSIAEGGASIAKVMAAEIQIENNLDESIYCIGGAGLRAQLPEGLARVSGRIKALFDDVTLYTKALNSTESSLEIVYRLGTGAGSAGNEQLTITINELQYAPASPVVSGPAGVLVELPFEAYYGDNAGASALTMVLLNTQATC
jgi:hypothetical protein